LRGELSPASPPCELGFHVSASFGLSPSGRRRVLIIAIVIALAALSAMDHAGVFGYHQDDQGKFHSRIATVLSAADGDTIEIDVPDHGEATTRVRLRGVACPEIAREAGETDSSLAREAGECLGEIVVARRVRLELDPNRAARDQSGRLLAYVYVVEDGRMVNELLLERGLACTDGRFQHIYQDRFTRLEKAAKKQRAGLWGAVTSEQMSAWGRHMDSGGSP
jgi:endonuclease YncB( thermonuclease family)